MKHQLNSIYRRLYARFGPQHWWPGDSPFEVMIGAILAQNTNWQNAAKAVSNLKEKMLLQPRRLHLLPRSRIASLIRSSGYYNIKARRLKEFLGFFMQEYQGSVGKMRRQDFRQLRRQLLGISGIGEETADSILLYALDKPVFVVDAYTKRILSRHGLIEGRSGYSDVQKLFMQNLRNSVELFNEYHALLVRLGKDYCLKKEARCQECPLRQQG